MAEFEVRVVKIDVVEHHPNADRLSIITIGGYTCISAKLEDGSHRYNAGDLVCYIPSASILPEWLLKKLDFWKVDENKGSLSGSAGNRVKAIRLRGIFSEGVLYPVNSHKAEISIDGVDFSKMCAPLELTYISNQCDDEYAVEEGDNVAAFLGIVKYEPQIPTHLAGEVASAPSITLRYDIEDLRKYDRVFEDGDQVVVAEKLHGTLCCLAYVPGLNHAELLAGDFFASSKGLSAHDRFFKNNDANANNLYHKYLLSNNVDGTPMTDVLRKISSHFENTSVYMLGEIFGKVQDLTYGLQTTALRVFDIFVGDPVHGRYLNDLELDEILKIVNVERVPVLYRGPFSIEKMTELRDGNTTFANIKQIREGIVIRSSIERKNKWIGRVQLKFVSPEYLLRKNKDATEFQ